MNNIKPTILIIFGISGDLSKRFLLPAVGELAKANMLPEHFHIIGLTRQPNIQTNSLLEKTANSEYVRTRMSIRQMDVSKRADYEALSSYIEEVEEKFNAPAELLFYLSVPSQATKSIIEHLGESMTSKIERAKLLLEKPFGYDLENAKDLAKHISQYFSPSQIYRVDHYMAKEVAQNIVPFRDGNSLFKKTWNKDFIEKIEIIASEAIDIEGRANFYEQTGALRDFIQNHLLQLLATVLMRLPENKEDKIPHLRLEALKQLTSINAQAKRGQYREYREEVNNPASFVETFASLILESNDEQWLGVPMTLTTGKALKNKFAEIRIFYKKDKEYETNELSFRIQPEEGIIFSIHVKRPGYKEEINSQNLSFNFKEYYEVLPKAYEQVLFYAMISNHNLFTSSDEVLETWRILDTLQKKWERGGSDLLLYEKGSTINEILNM